MFFEGDRSNFFRPLNGKRRELVMACLQALYERLHGPAADYVQNLTKEALRNLLCPVIQAAVNEITLNSDTTEDELSTIDLADDQQMANALIRSLVRDGWLETFADRVGLVTAYRFTRPGKLFAEAFWSLNSKRAHSRGRNMRSCRNALESFFKNRDPYDLIDAYEHAEKVICDLSEGIEYFQELGRRVMVQAAQGSWKEFIAFLSRFEQEFKHQLTVDSVERHCTAIKESLHKIRGIESAKARQLEIQLNTIAGWVSQEKQGGDTLDWFLYRIEDLIDAAQSIKQPELTKAMHGYTQRTTNIAQQAHTLRKEIGQPAYALAINQIASLDAGEQDAFLELIGDKLAAAGIRLLDPASFKLHEVSQRKKASLVTDIPIISKEARLNNALLKAEACAFALSNEEIHDALLEALRRQGGQLTLSRLPIGTATDVLKMMQAVEAIRSSREGVLKATRLSSRFKNDYFSGNDYLIEAIL